jgi:uncharacterized protein YcaQ
MPRLSQSDWASIRVEYEAGASANSLAEKYGVTHTAVNKKRAEQGWVQDLEAVIQRKVSEKVSGLVSGEIAQKRAEVVDAEAEKRAEVVKRHRAEWIQVARLRQEAGEIRMADPASSERRAKLAKLFAEITALQQAGERKAWGLDATVDVRKLTDEQLAKIIQGKEP